MAVARWLIDWPTTCMRGPRNIPELIASRISTVLKPPRESMSRTVVNPASRSTCALASAISVRRAGGMGWLRFRWTWPSIMPGMTVADPRSMTRAPAGTATPAPASAIRSPRTTITGLATIRPERESNMRAARMATTWFGGARNFPASGDAEGVRALAAADPSASWDRAAMLAAAAIAAARMTASLPWIRMFPPLSGFPMAGARNVIPVTRAPLGDCRNRVDNGRRDADSARGETDESHYSLRRIRRLLRILHGDRARPGRRPHRPGQLSRGRRHGRRRRQRQEGRLDDQRQRCHGRARALCLSGRAARARTLHVEGAPRRLLSRRAES